MTKPWAMARVASRRQLPKPRKMMGPVGRQIDAANNCMNDEEINRPTDKRIWFATGECSCCRECGYHVCSCEPVDPYASYAKDADAQFSPRTQAYLKYARFCAEQLDGMSGLNSVARGESEQPKPYSITQSDGIEQKIKPEPIGRDYTFPVQVNIESGQARALKLEASFDDHARHVANHVQLAERLGICGLCYSPDHKFSDCRLLGPVWPVR